MEYLKACSSCYSGPCFGEEDAKTTLEDCPFEPDRVARFYVIDKAAQEKIMEHLARIEFLRENIRDFLIPYMEKDYV